MERGTVSRLARHGCVPGGAAAWGVFLVLVLVVAIGAVGRASSPVLLVYGFQPIPGFYPPRLWQEFAEFLSGGAIGDTRRISIGEDHVIYLLTAAGDDKRDVYISHYATSLEPTLRDLLYYTGRFAEEVEWIVSSSGVRRLDVVAHSMGGLIARCYIESADLKPYVGTPGIRSCPFSYRNDIATLVTLATPHGGTEFAALGPWFGPLSDQIAPGSGLLDLLNADLDGRGSLNPDVRYVSMAGQSCLGCGVRRDPEPCLTACVDDARAWTGSDLVIPMASARLPGAENVACLGMDHVDMHAHPALVAAIEAILNGASAPLFVCGSSELAAAAGL